MLFYGQLKWICSTDILKVDYYKRFNTIEDTIVDKVVKGMIKDNYDCPMNDN